MDANHQDKTGSKPIVTEEKIWLPPAYINKKPSVALAPKKRGIDWGFADRTVFDWALLISQVLGAIAIPFIVLVIGVYATQQITQQQTQLSVSQHQLDLQIAKDQQQATLLQTYIDNIQDLLLNHNLLKSKSTDDVAALARARTLTALQGLNPERKGRLLMFLHEANLIGYQNLAGQGTKANPYLSIRREAIISLKGANLHGTILTGTNLSGIDLSIVPYEGCGISSVNRAELVDLSGADLSGANLSGTNLGTANLSRANLSRADLSLSFLSGASLSQINLAGANLSEADLSGTDLSSANLRGVYLSSTRLVGAKLNGANLSGADLSGAFYLSQHSLDQVYSCKNAILPESLECHHNRE